MSEPADVFEAIQQYSALLSFRLDESCKKRGWAVKPLSLLVTPQPGRTLQLVSVSVHLPRGDAASFNPRAQAEPDGKCWLIDVRRSDGVIRKSWAHGLRVALAGRGYLLLCPEQPLSDETLEAMLDELGKPGPSGVALWVRRLWGMRFGPMPLQVTLKLDAIKDVDRLDAIHRAILKADQQKDAEAAVLAA